MLAASAPFFDWFWCFSTWAYYKPRGSIAAAQHPCAYKGEVPTCSTPESTDVYENCVVYRLYTCPGYITHGEASGLHCGNMHADCMALAFWTSIVPQEQAGYRLFAQNDVVNIAAETAMPALCLRDKPLPVKTNRVFSEIGFFPLCSQRPDHKNNKILVFFWKKKNWKNVNFLLIFFWFFVSVFFSDMRF